MSDELIEVEGRLVYAIGGRPNSPGFLDGCRSFVLPNGNRVSESRGRLWEHLRPCNGICKYALYIEDTFTKWAMEVRAEAGIKDDTE